MRIERHQGNTKRIRRKVVDKDTGEAIDVTGHIFVLTVNSDEDPLNTDNQQFAITAIHENSVAGLIYFPYTSTEADIATGTYYYDIEWTDQNTETETLEDGTYVVCARINQT